jgi:hypothetical protein
MGKTIITRIDSRLAQVFENIRKSVAIDIKRKYNLQEIVVPNTLSSEILAAEKLGKKPFFKVRKIGLNKGVLELFWS